MHEFELIKKFFKPLTSACREAQNLADDVAKISLRNGEELVVSKDVFVEDVHFLLQDGGFKIASKLLRTNLSDIAASGARPLYYMLGFSKNKNTDEKFCREFAKGLKSVQEEFGLSLIGGDTVSAQKLFFSVTIFGAVKRSKILCRNQAKDGDLIFVSGTIGDAYLGLKTAFDKHVLERHFFPTPRIELGKMLLEKKLSKCAIDVSDGLLADLGHICRESKLGAEVHLDQIPISNSAHKVLGRSGEIKLTDLISGGDDYELVFAVNPKKQKRVLELAATLKVNLTCIGQFKKQSDNNSEVTLLDAKNKKIKIKKLGYEH